MHIPKVGLLQFVSHARQEEIKRELRLDLEDLFNAIDHARANAEELEANIDEVLYGNCTVF